MATLGFLLAGRHDRVASSGGAEFLCPMHLEVTSGVPGQCPICGMALVKARAFGRDLARNREDSVPEDTIAAAKILSGAAGGVAPNLVGYYPSPLRQHVLRYEVFAPAWLETEVDLAVLVYRDQLPALDPSEVALFSATALPATQRQVRLVPGAPRDWDPSLSLVHFVVVDASLAAAPGLQRGTVGWVKFPARPRAMRVIPAGAVLQSPEGPYVLVVASDRGTATKQPIQVGRIVTGLAAVLSGLELHQQVVSVNAFFWDAERRLQGERRAGGGGVPP